MSLRVKLFIPEVPGTRIFAKYQNRLDRAFVNAGLPLVFSPSFLKVARSPHSSGLTTRLSRADAGVRQ
jgi:hypothetical protein